MSKLAAIRKKIAALEAAAERISKSEMQIGIAKVRALMSDFGLTIEHLSQAVSGKPAVKKAKAKSASTPKYADPTSGKTWSGFGRAPGWIAGAKNRDEFLVSTVKVTAKPAATKKVATKTTAPVAKRAKAKAAASASSAAKKAAAPKVASNKKPASKAAAAKKPATKKVTKTKAAAKKAAPRTAKATDSMPASAGSPTTAA
jgi:DNA-binding protein H-NS